MAQLVKALVANPDGLSSVCGTHFVESENLTPLSCLLNPHMHKHTHTHKQNTITLKIFILTIRFHITRIKGQFDSKAQTLSQYKST